MTSVSSGMKTVAEAPSPPSTWVVAIKLPSMLVRTGKSISRSPDIVVVVVVVVGAAG